MKIVDYGYIDSRSKTDVLAFKIPPKKDTKTYWPSWAKVAYAVLPNARSGEWLIAKDREGGVVEYSWAVDSFFNETFESVESYQNAAPQSGTTEEQHSVPTGFASQIINTVRNRGNEYGPPSTNHQLTADLLSHWATRRFSTPITFLAEDVCVFNIIQKISRLANVSKDDTLLDVAGYTENIAMLKPEQRNLKK